MVKKKETRQKQDNSKLCSILSYLIIGLIWYAVDEDMKKSKSAKFHVKQGLVLLIASIAYGIILRIIFSILFFPLMFGGAMMGGFGLFGLLSYVPLIWTIIGIVNAANDRNKELPIIGQYADRFNF